MGRVMIREDTSTPAHGFHYNVQDPVYKLFEAADDLVQAGNHSKACSIYWTTWDGKDVDRCDCGWEKIMDAYYVAYREVFEEKRRGDDRL